MNVIVFCIINCGVVVVIFSRYGNKNGVVIFILCKFGFLFCKFRSKVNWYLYVIWNNNVIGFEVVGFNFYIFYKRFDVFVKICYY